MKTAISYLSGIVGLAFVAQTNAQVHLRNENQEIVTNRTLADCPWPSNEHYHFEDQSGFAMEFLDTSKYDKINYVELWQSATCTHILRETGLVNMESLAKQYKAKNCFQPGDLIRVRIGIPREACPVVSHVTYRIKYGPDVRSKSMGVVLRDRDTPIVNAQTPSSGSEIGQFAHRENLPYMDFGQELKITTKDVTTNPAQRVEIYKYYFYESRDCNLVLDADERNNNDLSYESLRVKYSELKSLKPGCFAENTPFWVIAYSRNYVKPILLPMLVAPRNRGRNVEISQTRDTQQFKFAIKEVGCEIPPTNDEINKFREFWTGFAMTVKGELWDRRGNSEDFKLKSAQFRQGPECIHTVYEGDVVNMERLAKQYKQRNCFQEGDRFLVAATLENQECETIAEEQFIVNFDPEVSSTVVRVQTFNDTSPNFAAGDKIMGSTLDLAVELARERGQDTRIEKFGNRIIGYIKDHSNIERERVGAVKYAMFENPKCIYFVDAFERSGDDTIYATIDISIASIRRAGEGCFADGSPFNLVMYSENEMSPIVAPFRLSFQSNETWVVFDLERNPLFPSEYLFGLR